MSLDLSLAVERISRPRAGEVAPLGELPRRVAQPIDRAVVAAEGRTPQRPAHALGRIRQLLLEPSAERIVEQPRRRRLGEHFEQRIDARLDRPLAQQIGAEAVDGADVRLLESRERCVEQRATRSSAPASVRARSSRSRNRSLSSPAAFSVNVTATILSTSVRPSARMRTIRPTSSVVLPVPAAASTTSVSSRCWRSVSRAVGVGQGQISKRVMASPAARSGRRSSRPACGAGAALRPVRRPGGSRTTCRRAPRAREEESRARWRGR